jgi:predicted Ser/Thr protein kinase
MEEFDTTTPKKTESERLVDHVDALFELLEGINERLEKLEHQVARLEVRKVILEHRNDDEEWF